jgi:predicted RecA/RadA family phage recombinase
VKNRVQDPLGAEMVDFDNTSGAQVNAGDVVDLDGLGFGIVYNDTPDAMAGVAYTAGVYKLPKAAGGGTALVKGQSVGWDAANKRVTTAVAGRVLGTVYAAAADGDTEVQVRINDDPEEYTGVVVGNASGAGLAVVTGTGQSFAGPVHVISTDAAGTLRTITSITQPVAGTITIVTTAGAGTDKHHIRARRT